jgi:hypothetical protein
VRWKIAALLQAFGLRIGLCGHANVLQCGWDFLLFCEWEEKTK